MDGVGLREFLRSCVRLLRRARKPDRDELWLLIRICTIGLLVVGAVGFAIRLLMLTVLGGG